MTGGLLQLASSGQEDVYLTINPEITFFKKVYHRHTHFSTELQYIYPDQSIEYNEEITFKIENNGDALHRCYLEIDLPILSFSDTSIDNNEYNIMKINKIARINDHITNYTSLYNNMRMYADNSIILYRNLKKALLITNITTTLLQNIVQTFFNQYKININININILNETSISEYILGITQLVGINITGKEIENNIDTMYNKIVYWLKYYFNMIQFYSRQLNNSNINFNYAEYLGHNYFNYFRLDIGGIEVSNYDNQYLHIQQMHNIKKENQENYFKMIGHNPDLNTYNNLPKGGNKILVPLLFWFCKDIGSSLPLIAMQYQTTVLTVTINKINKIICFENWGKMYDDLLIVIESFEYNPIQINSDLDYSSFNIDHNNQKIVYNCNSINKELLSIQFPNLSDTDITEILSFGNTIDINKDQWIYFMTVIDSTLSVKMELYNSFIDYNVLYSSVNTPNIALVAEYIYFDEVERGKFATSKLEYVIENIDMDVYNVSNQPQFNCELSFTKPVKELYWYFQPNIFTNMLSQFGQNMDLLFNVTDYLPNILNSQSLQLDQYEIITNTNFNVYNNYSTMLSYKYLNNSLPSGVYYHTFSLYPEETQPSGTANLSVVRSKIYNCVFNSDFIDSYYNNIDANNLNLNSSILTLKFYAKSYNVFVVDKGRGEMIFTI